MLVDCLVPFFVALDEIFVDAAAFCVVVVFVFVFCQFVDCFFGQVFLSWLC